MTFSPPPAHRRLLAAYPARLRRRYGAELITTMLEMTGPGERPAPAVRRRVVLDGLRERFRLPAGRPLAVLAAVLAVLVAGALGAAAGAWTGTLTYADLPAAGPLASRVMEPGGTEIVRTGGGTYLSIADTLAPGSDPAAVVSRVRQRLAAEGWVTGAVSTDGPPHFRAATDDAELSVYAYAGDSPILQIAGWPTRPAAYVWLTLAGLLLGVLAGWLLAASAAHRIAAARRGGISAVLAIAGLVALLVPAIAFMVSLIRYLTVVDALGTGGLLQPFTFGPSLDAIRGLGVSGYFAQSGSYDQFTLAGVLAIAAALALARPGTAGARRQPA